LHFMRIAQLNTLKKFAAISKNIFLKIRAPNTHSSVETTQVYAKIVGRMKENTTLHLEKMLMLMN